MVSRTELHVVMVLLTIMSVVGTVGNALVLFVFSKKKDRMTSTLFILALAFVDFITCLIVIPYTIYIEYVDYHIRFDVLCKLYQFLITCNIPFSAFIMVAIAIDRYLCICHPFLNAMNNFRAKVMIACLGILAAVIGILVSLMYGVYQMVLTDPVYNVPVAVNASGNHLGVGAVLGSPAEDGVSDLEQVEAHIIKTKKLRISMKVYTGHCAQNEFVLSSDFGWYYSKFYAAVFLICVIIVTILYALIFHSVLTHRKHQRAQNKRLPLMVVSGNENKNIQEDTIKADTETMNTDIESDATTAPHSSGEEPVTTSPKDADDKKKGKSIKKDCNRSANLKTAAVLFVVIVVFVVTFLPAFLMSMQLIPYSMAVFYMYFANNVANPFIYSFMNKNFRDDLRRIICMH